MTILPNFLCEYDMAGRLGDLPRSARAVEKRFSHVLRLVPGWEDSDVETDPDRLRTTEHAAKRPILAWCDLWGFSHHVPREVVVRANDQRTSLHIEQKLGIGLPGACVVCSIGEVDDAISSAPGQRWVVKHPFGVAGRERVLGTGEPTDAARRWCARQFDRGTSLVFEPWVDDAHEYSTQWQVGADVRWVGGCGLLTHGDGTFRGISPAATVPDEVVRQARLAAEEIAAMGYRGPVGIDAIVGRLGDLEVDSRLSGQAAAPKAVEVLRGVMEINARWTFGRIGLHLLERAGRPIVWRHDRAPAAVAPWTERDSATAFRLPGWADPGGRSQTWITPVA
jgi:hypothetical protein